MASPQPSPSPSPSPTTSSYPSSCNGSEVSDDAAPAPLKGDGPKRELDRAHPTESTMAPRPSSPVAKTLEGQDAQDREPWEEEPELVDNDGERPISPVAKALLSQSSSVLEEEGAPDDDAKPPADGRKGSAIPNLLSSGRFPPPPHSPRRNFSPRTSASPPPIVASPGLASPRMPAAPPSTPYTPFAGATVGGVGVPTLHPPLQLGNALSSLPIRATSPPLLNNAPSSPMASPSASRQTVTAGDVQPPNIPPVSPGGTVPPLDPHYHALLNQALQQTAEREKARVASLTEHEAQNYTNIDEYQHALSRERRHSTSLAMELTHFQFLTNYTSCNVHMAAEISEEARINSLIKGIDTLKKGMNEDRCRVVMELEREEERMINNLMMRLEEVEREKRLLEQQISSVRGGGGFASAGVGGEEQGLHARLERMMAPSLPAAAAAGQQTRQAPNIAQTGSGGAAAAEVTEKTNNMDEDSEEGDEGNEDILGGKSHDPQMEEELANLLKMKESK